MVPEVIELERKKERESGWKAVHAGTDLTRRNITIPRSVRRWQRVCIVTVAGAESVYSYSGGGRECV